MSESFGLVHSVMAPILRKVAREERPGWDRPRKRPDPRPPHASAGAAAADSETASADAGEHESPGHIDLRV